MEFPEAVLLQVFAEQVFDGNADIGDSLADRSPLVHGWVIEMCCETGEGCAFNGLPFFLIEVQRCSS